MVMVEKDWLLDTICCYQIKPVSGWWRNIPSNNVKKYKITKKFKIIKIIYRVAHMLGGPMSSGAFGGFW